MGEHTAEAHASHSAVVAGDADTSGVDEAAAHHGHDHGHHNHEPAVMMVPLYLLAFGALFAGFINLPGLHTLGHFLGHSPSFIGGYAVAAETFPGFVSGDPDAAAEHAAAWGQPSLGHAPFPWVGFLTATVIALAGIALAWFMHLKSRSTAETVAEKLSGLSLVLEGKYWVDSIYQALIVEPLRALGKLLYWVDATLVSGAVFAAAYVPVIGGYFAGAAQNGALQGYAGAMLLGVALLLLLMFVAVPGWLVWLLIAAAVLWVLTASLRNPATSN